MKPQFIWTDDGGKGRNRYALFRKTFALPAPPATGTLHIFADTRYRLLVNGTVVAHGPSRFAVAFPEYDTHDIGMHLRPGRNAIAVMVNSIGRSTFNSEASIGGLIAWGEVVTADAGRHPIVTDATWRAIESPGHERETAILTFALNPAEIVDLGAMPVGWEQSDYDDSPWPGAIPLSRQDHWGAPRPRSIALLDESEAVPASLGIHVAKPAVDEERITFSRLVEGGGCRAVRRAVRGFHLHPFSPGAGGNIRRVVGAMAVYAADHFIQSHVALAAFGNADLMRRGTERLFQTQDGAGFLAGRAPAAVEGCAVDFALFPLRALWQYYAWTGDIAFGRAMAPRARRLLDAVAGLIDPASGLVPWLTSYVDLGLLERGGENCAVNCFAQRAFADGAKLMQRVGDRGNAARYARHAASLAAVIRRGFWSEQHGAFTDRRAAAMPGTTPSVHANTLPLLYGIADGDQSPRAMEWLLGALREYHVEGRTYRVQPSFAFHVLKLLDQAGRAAAAENFIRAAWGAMLDRGARTWWEFFDDRHSLCHAWSGAPTYYLSTAVLGVQFPEPGTMDRLRIAPRAGTLDWAEGVFPHPRGEIRIAWKRDGDRLALSYQVPDGVAVMVAPGIESAAPAGPGIGEPAEMPSVE